MNGWKKCTSLKTVTHHTKWRRTAVTCKFQCSIHKRNVFIIIFFNITYVHSMKHHAVRLLSRRYGYKYWKLKSTLVHRVTWRSLWKIIADTVTISRNVEGPLRAANIYKMLRNEYKNNFSVRSLTVCTLNDVTLVHFDSSSVRITMTEMTLWWMFDWRMYRCNVRTISPTRCQIYTIFQHCVRRHNTR